MAEVIERTNGNGRQLVHDAVRKLRVREFLGNTLFIELYADDTANTVSGNFNEAQQQHLLYEKQLTLGGFTQVNLSTIRFKSVHSYRIYWLLNSYPKGTKQTIDLFKFRKMVLGDVTKYEGWTELNRSVLKLVAQQFEEVGLSFDYLEVRKGNKITDICLSIPDFASKVPAPPKQPRPPKPEPRSVSTTELNSFEQACRQYPRYWGLYCHLHEHYNLEKNVIEHAINWILDNSEFRYNRLMGMLKRINRQAAYKQVRDLGRYTLSSLKKLRVEVEAIEHEQQEKQALRTDREDSNSLAQGLANKFNAK